jgi:SAM-dependent methyltransferase
VADELVLTGERTLPGIADENYWFRRHEAAYLALLPFCQGARILDLGCGEGYGAALLRRVAATVVAVDDDEAVTRHVARRYPHVGVVRGDLQQLPIGDGAVEVVASLQTVEHLHDQPGFVAECARVLRPAGTLLLTTPNRLTFSPGRTEPLNPFHTRELSPDELVELLAPHFDVARSWGLHHGARLARWERRHGSLVGALVARPDPAGWGADLRAAVQRTRADDFEVGPHAVDSSLDLVVVAVRRG